MTHISKKVSIAMMISVFVVTMCFSVVIFPSNVYADSNITIDGTISSDEWDAYYLGTSVTSWQGGMSVDVYGYADDTYLYVAYVADMTQPGWNVAASLGIGPNFDYLTPLSATWPESGYTHISVGGDGFAQTDSSGWVWPDGWGNTDPAVFTNRGIDYYIGDPMWNTVPNPNVAELKIPLSLLTYAGNDGLIRLSGQYWQYDWATPFYVSIAPPPPETKADILKDSGVPGKGLENAPGLNKQFNPNSQADEHAGMK